MLFNGDPPYTRSEAEAEGIEWNYSNKRGAKIAHDARGRFNNGFLSTSAYYTMKLDSGPKHKRQEWSVRATNERAKIMKASLAYETTLRETFATLALHGCGPVLWPDKYRWNPKVVGLMDLKVPSRTYVNFRNLTEFAVYREWTPGELQKKIGGTDPGWKRGLANKSIKWAIDRTLAGSSNSMDFDIWRNPEKFWEEFRANVGYWCSDAVQTIKTYDFYHQDPKDDKWYRKIVLDGSSEITGSDK